MSECIVYKDGKNVLHITVFTLTLPNTNELSVSVFEFYELWLNLILWWWSSSSI